MKKLLENVMIFKTYSHVIKIEYEVILQCIPNLSTHEQNLILESMPTREELTKVVFEMNHN